VIARSVMPKRNSDHASRQETWREHTCREPTCSERSCDEHGSRNETWRRHLASINFGYVLFAIALIWLGGSAYLAR
jgi:hypothetical protein